MRMITEMKGKWLYIHKERNSTFDLRLSNSYLYEADSLLGHPIDIFRFCFNLAPKAIISEIKRYYVRN